MVWQGCAPGLILDDFMLNWGGAGVDTQAWRSLKKQQKEAAPWRRWQEGVRKVDILKGRDSVGELGGGRQRQRGTLRGQELGAHEAG